MYGSREHHIAINMLAEQDSSNECGYIDNVDDNLRKLPTRQIVIILAIGA